MPMPSFWTCPAGIDITYCETCSAPHPLSEYRRLRMAFRCPVPAGRLLTHATAASGSTCPHAEAMLPYAWLRALPGVILSANAAAAFGSD